MFKWRLENKNSFYHTLVEWWDNWGFPCVQKSSIPNSIFIVSKNEEDLYAIPIYKTDSDICWIGFPTSNRKAEKENKEGSLDFLMSKIEDVMKQEGFNIILTTSGTPKLMSLFSMREFTASDEGVTFYTKKL